jgi:hypothetical protein
MPTPQPLFILTCMRSFSSLVSSMLGQHSGLYCLPEVNPFIADTVGAGVDILQVVRKRTLDGLYRAVAELEFGGQSEDAVLQAVEWINQRRHWSAVDLMGWFAEKVAPRRLIEKSPSTVLAADRLGEAIRLFPRASFLHLYRHPVTTTASIAKITQASQSGRRRTMRDPETSWSGANQIIIDMTLKLPSDQVLAVRGEDILEDPDRYLSQICGWLGLTTSARDLAEMKQPQNSPYAHVGPPSAPFGNDPTFLKHPEYARRAITLPTLDSALDWATPERRLKVETINLALQLGYV